MSTPNPDVIFASGPTYVVGGNTMLLPFTYKNSRLDLPGTSYPSGTTGVPIGNGGATIRKLGGIFPVTSIGPNLATFITNTVWDDYTIVPGSITVPSSATVTRVQQLSMSYLPSTWDNAAYKLFEGAWNYSNFIGPASVFLFNSPLVLQMRGTKNGVTRTICITLQTSWDH